MTDSCRFHSSSLRSGRFSESGRAYLITTTTRARRPVFHDLRLGLAVVQTLKAADNAQRTNTLAYVLMPDHLHWLLMLGEGENLLGIVGWVKGVSARRIGLMAGLTGIWQTGFHDRATRSEEDLHALARYVVANPLRAGIVARLGDYPLWDSVYLSL
ncbi:transposase [Aromatoleum evansii]|uniref:Transposase n=1 Tax=Aromatoleum evansii TaxID=59406 RepID=A0ABZ1AIL5_AROEV|nr:transposase [Aromatoleum evansii]